MAITFGVMLHVDRAPAAVTAPAHQPVIEASVVSSITKPVLPVESARHGHLSMARQWPGSEQFLPTYDVRGERRSGGEQTGRFLDLFA